MALVVQEIQALTFKNVLRLVLRAWPYYRPQLKHIITYLLLNVVTGALLLTSGLVGNDLLNNKVLVGTPLQPAQATLLFVDDSYVTTGEEGEALTEDQRRTVRNRLFVWAFIGALLLMASFSLVYYYMVWIFQNINQDLRVKMIEQAENLSLRYHSDARTGDAIYRVYQDSATITNVLQQVVITPLRAVAWIFWGVILLTFFSPWLGLLCLLTAVPVVGLFMYFSPRIRVSAQRAREANSDLTSRIQEVFAAIRVVKANRAESEMMRRFDEDSGNALDAAFVLRVNIVLLSMSILVLGFGVVLIAEYLMASWTLSETATFLGGVVSIVGFAYWNLGAYQSAAGNIAQTARQSADVAQIWGGAADLLVGLQRAYFLLDLEPEVTEPDDPVTFPGPVGSVNWQDVRFSYDGDTPVLKSVSLSAAAGTITAIVGSTGSGKSTLMSLLLRLYDPDEGAICINGTPITRFGIDDLRSNIAIALQQNLLFTASVADNIAYATKDRSRDEIIEAARIACADEFIAEMPDGYDTELGERGSKLSTGQRQRLTIARALLRDTPILILDEPTASLDAETERQVLSNIAQWGKDRIVFLITHRLSTIRSADQIAFLHRGSIAEVGNHETLMASEAGHYRRFVHAEAGTDQ
ncbi:MAG: ABC transporter ATP-binding protein [Proteobacteria bacterium]|nr:ABC transporter ATP-binding protein [Pseudomonadota bacterium]MDA1299473.1 ABC transporter ATP-binding protein [Pseudomonadota bacterium]